MIHPTNLESPFGGGARRPTALARAAFRRHLAPHGRPDEPRPTFRRRRAAPHGAHGARARRISTAPRTTWSSRRTSTHVSEAARGAPRRSRARHFDGTGNGGRIW